MWHLSSIPRISLIASIFKPEANWNFYISVYSIVLITSFFLVFYLSSLLILTNKRVLLQKEHNRIISRKRKIGLNAIKEILPPDTETDKISVHQIASELNYSIKEVRWLLESFDQ
jgi:hypothetical protein